MNRAQRRKLKLNTPSRLPINLGISQYKREHKGESKRIEYYKTEMWKTYNDLKEE